MIQQVIHVVKKNLSKNGKNSIHHRELHIYVCNPIGFAGCRGKDSCLCYAYMYAYVEELLTVTVSSLYIHA